MYHTDPPLVVIAGPTGVGKSDLALEIGAELHAEIVSADSRQVYRHLDIGTAKPSAQDRARLVHHLIDYVDPDEAFSVARYRDDAELVLGDLGRRSVPALIVGGTGHYIQVLVDRIEPPRVPPDQMLRAQLEQIAHDAGAEHLHVKLAREDPDAAALIPPTNVRRVIRALEVIAATGEPFSRAGRRRGEPRAALRLALTLPRDALYERVDRRVERMLRAGWIGEVARLLDGGYSADLPALSSTGYREIVAHLRGELRYDDMVRKIKWSTHAYVRRQYVWLRRQPDYVWIESSEQGLARARQLVREHFGLA